MCTTTIHNTIGHLNGEQGAQLDPNQEKVIHMLFLFASSLPSEPAEQDKAKTSFAFWASQPKHDGVARPRSATLILEEVQVRHSDKQVRKMAGIGYRNSNDT